MESSVRCECWPITKCCDKFRDIPRPKVPVSVKTTTLDEASACEKLIKICRTLAIALMTKDKHSKSKFVFKKEVVVAMVGFGF